MKNPILQTYKFYDYSDIEIEFVIKTKIVDLDSITDLISLKPTRGWSVGDRYMGKQMNTESKQVETIEREQNNTLWAFNTGHFVSEPRFEEHAKFLIEKLKDKKETIKSILSQGDKFEVNVFITMTIDRSEVNVGLGTSTELLRELIDLCNYIEWRTEE